MSTLILLLSLLESASAWGTRAAKKGRPAKSRMNGVLIIVKATALVGGVFVFYYAFFKVVARINRTPFGEWIKKVSWSLVGERMVEWLKSNRRREEERVGRKIDWDKMD
ncbi:hypothetical protein TrVE_jg13942 [Triparma verrucosa]|uniref:Uncharacterized protein n=2 Tax=Triparma TaxID=722752 RepID=A0A9W7A6A6_9STRA|nr:hypothetical protein TrST_g11298 [Triparma strigata]GMI15031.1 hypothetical protein TrVE_jg13942 [Triparma verrucosa]